MASKARIAAIVGAGVLALAAPIITHFEGVEHETYFDIVGIPTICYGHTKTAVPGMTATPEQCERLLRDDMQMALSGLVDCVYAELEPNEWAALTSWAYNVGNHAACTSTLVRKINRGEPAESWCQELPRWVYAGGKKVRGLERRRQEELALCLRG